MVSEVGSKRLLWGGGPTASVAPSTSTWADDFALTLNNPGDLEAMENQYHCAVHAGMGSGFLTASYASSLRVGLLDSRLLGIGSRRKTT